MSTANELLRQMDVDRFQEVFGASSKAFREEILRVAGVRKKNSSASVRSTNKTRERAEKLLGALRNGLSLKAEVEDEIIRNYLFTRRALLGDALDYLGVPHDNGLTDTELDFVDQLPPEKGQALRSTLEAKHERPDVDLYLSFMKIPGA